VSWKSPLGSLSTMLPKKRNTPIRNGMSFSRISNRFAVFESVYLNNRGSIDRVLPVRTMTVSRVMARHLLAIRGTRRVATLAGGKPPFPTGWGGNLLPSGAMYRHCDSNALGIDRAQWCPLNKGPVQGKEEIMLYYALVFLVLGLVANVLGAYGVAAVASQIAWVLFVIGIVLLVVHLVSGRRTLAP
jgi:uncharacterized membrane protein YtjA (UPF0391 family)